MLGHGTGTIETLFRRAAAAQPDALVTANPHSQVFAVAVQLGIVGAALLIAMWLAHLALFTAATPIAWFGLIVVVQNIVGSLFNSHLSDFTQGWIYVLGVGVLGGALRADRATERPAGDMMPAPVPANELQGMPEPARILVITLRRLGDVLLTTPLIRTLRRGYPRARLDVLAFRGGERILAGNPDIAEVVTMSERPTARETAALIGRLWRRYDLVVSTQSGDRPTFFAMIAGRRRIGLVPPAGMTGARWKRRAYHVAIAPEPDTHRVTQLRQLTDALGLPFAPELVCPQGADASAAPRAPYAVLHANPAYRYKRWTAEGWRALARALAGRGFTVVVTGGPDPGEQAYLDDLWTPVEPAVVRLDGRLDWPQLAALLAGAAVYVGVDTSMTHLAAGSRVPHRGALRADQPPADRSLAGGRPCRALGARPGPSSSAAMSWWCRIRCPACRARSSAAPGISTATASASMN